MLELVWSGFLPGDFTHVVPVPIDFQLGTDRGLGETLRLRANCNISRRRGSYTVPVYR